MKFKLSPLIIGREKYYPSWIKTFNDAEYFVKSYIPVSLKKFSKQKLHSIDVFSEVFESKNPFHFDILCEAYKQARKAAGNNVQLYYSDFGHESMTGK